MEIKLSFDKYQISENYIPFFHISFFFLPSLFQGIISKGIELLLNKNQCSEM